MNSSIFSRFISFSLLSITFYFLLYFVLPGFESTFGSYETDVQAQIKEVPAPWTPKFELTREGFPIWETQKGIDPTVPILNWWHGWTNSKGKKVEYSKTLVQNYLYSFSQALPVNIFYDYSYSPIIEKYFPPKPSTYFPSPEVAGKASVGKPIREFWYLMVEKGNQPTAWLEGFEAVSGKPLGYFGAKGHQFHKPTPSERIVLCHYGPTSLAAFWINNFSYEHTSGYPGKRSDPYPMELTGEGELWVSTPGSIQEINIAHRTIREFAKTDGNVQIKMIPGPMTEKDSSGNPNYSVDNYMFVAQSQNEIQLLDHLGIVKGKAFVPKEDWPKSYCIFADPKNGLTLVYATDSTAFSRPEERQLFSSNPLHPDGKIHQTLKHFTPNGEVDREEPLSIEPIIAAYSPRQMRPSFLHCLSNPLYGYFPFLESKLFQSPKPELFPWILVGSLFNFFLIVLMTMRQRQFGESLWTIPLWGLLIIVFGLAGWLGYRFHRAWPPLVCCGNCKAKRPSNLAECPRCQAAFAKPQLTGKEIFQDAPTLPVLGGI